MPAFKDHYQDITNQIVAALEAGHKPWVRPWNPDLAGGPAAPMNPTTGRRYRGINTLLLGMSPLAFTTNDPRWCTYKQANEKGWQVRKGEKSTGIFFYKQLQAKDTDQAGDDRPAARMIPVLRSYSVFHASQIDGVPAFAVPALTEAPWRSPEAVETIMKNSGSTVRIGGDRAFYSPTTDHIQLPPDTAFTGPYECGATKLHELGHWTGHTSRMDRDLRNRFGSAAYSAEELRAELMSVFVGAEIGLPVEIQNHASYLASWITTLRDDKREIFRAASEAQRMADYVLAFHPAYAASLAAEAGEEAMEARPATLNLPICSSPRVSGVAL